MCDIHILTHRPVSKQDITSLNVLRMFLRNKNTAFTEASIAEMSECERTVIFVARTSEGIVGMITLERDPPCKEKRDGMLKAFVVLPRARNAGVGTALLTRAIAVADLSGTTRLTLRSRADRVHARHLYKKMGFKAQKKHTTLFVRVRLRQKPG